MGLGTKLMMMAPKAGVALLSAGGDVASGFDVTTIMSESVKTTQGQMFSVLGLVVPAIVAIVAAGVAVKYGLSWLKKIRG